MNDPVSPHVRLTRLIRAPREKVYNAWIDPKVRQQWWCAYEGMTCGVCEIDATAGGKYRTGMTDPQGNGYVSCGEFVELSPYDRIVFTWSWEHAPDFGANSRVTVTFHDAEFEGRPATELVLLHEKLGSAHERSAHTTGWLGALKSLGKLFADLEDAELADACG